MWQEGMFLNVVGLVSCLLFPISRLLLYLFLCSMPESTRKNHIKIFMVVRIGPDRSVRLETNPRFGPKKSFELLRDWIGEKLVGSVVNQ